MSPTGGASGWAVLGAVLLAAAPCPARALPVGRLVLTPPSFDPLLAEPAGLAGLDGGGSGVLLVRREEPGLSLIEFLLDWGLRLGEGAGTLALLSYSGYSPWYFPYYGSFSAPSADYLLAAMAWELVHPLLDALLVAGVGSLSPWFYPRYAWTLVGAYSGSIIGGLVFWFLAWLAPEGAIVWGIAAAALASGITVGTQTQTKRLRPRWRLGRPAYGDGDPPPVTAQAPSPGPLPAIVVPVVSALF